MQSSTAHEAIDQNRPDLLDYQGHQHIKLNAVTAWLKQRIDEPLAGSNHYDGFLRHNASSHDIGTNGPNAKG